jgi:predicted transcriptional regulator
MRSPLITVLLSSEKRTDLLMFLKEKPRTIEEINSELDTNSVAILPQLKRLKENGLVVQEDRVYSLSLMGKILVRRMESLVKAFRLLENNFDYWSDINSGRVPPIFFKLMEEFMSYMPDGYQGDSSLVYEKMTEAFCSSKQILLIISCPDLRYFDICAEYAKKGLKVSIILTQKLFDKFAEEFKEELDTMITLENSEVYILGNDITPPTLAVTDTMVFTCFPSGKSNESNSTTIVGLGEKAVNLGREIFEHFRALAEPLVPWTLSKATLPDN